MNKKQLFIAVLVSIVSCGLQAMMTRDNDYVKPQEQNRPSERRERQEKREKEQREKKDRKGSKAFFF